MEISSSHCLNLYTPGSTQKICQQRYMDGTRHFAMYIYSLTRNCTVCKGFGTNLLYSNCRLEKRFNNLRISFIDTVYEVTVTGSHDRVGFLDINVQLEVLQKEYTEWQ